MQRQRTVLLATFLVIALLTALLHAASLPSAAQQAPTATPAIPAGLATAEPAFRSSPVMFIENAGQWPEGALFQVWGGLTETVWLAEDAIWVTVVESTSTQTPPLQGEESVPATPPSLASKGDGGLGQGADIRLSFVGANPHPRIEPFDRLDAQVSYFIGNDPEQWRGEVPVWGGVRYVDIYPGVNFVLGADLVPPLDGRQAQPPSETWGRTSPLAWRVETREGADLSAVRLRVEGADAVAVDANNLYLNISGREAVLPLLLTEEASDKPSLHPGVAPVFDVSTPFTHAHPNRQPAVEGVQPGGPLYSTFLGGSGLDSARAIAIDDRGAAYVAGTTTSSYFPTTPGALDTSLNGYKDVFVSKVNPTGTSLEYATFLGGNSDDTGYDIALGQDGTIYVMGRTLSRNFPATSAAFDTSQNGGADVFVSKLSAAGNTLVYSTYLGGSLSDYGYGIAVDGSGNSYVTGATWSPDFPTTPGAFDRTLRNTDAFVVKLNALGSTLVYSTLLDTAQGHDIALDTSGAAYVAGQAWSSDFPTTAGAFDPTFNGPSEDAFVTKLSPSGSALIYSTFLGGGGQECEISGDEKECSIVVDAGGAAYVVGSTNSSDFPTTVGAFDVKL